MPLPLTPCGIERFDGSDLSSLSAWADSYRAKNTAVAPRAVEDSIGIQIGVALKTAASATHLEAAVNRLAMEDLASVVVALVREFRQCADSPDAYAAWDA